MNAELAARLAGRRVVASVSGGKDSAAMSLWLTEQGIEHDRVFMDTGWEHPVTYEYLRGPLTKALGPILELRAPFTMAERAEQKGMFPAGKARWCTDELKKVPLLRHLEGLIDGGDDIVNCVGIRAQESAQRAEYPEWEPLEWRRGRGKATLHYDVDVWRPILKWTVDDVIAIHRRNGLAPNPLYLRGYHRVGCFPCIRERKDGIRRMADKDAWAIDRVRDLERVVTAAQLASRARRGLEPLPNAPAWFQGGDGACVPIDRVVEWSRTTRGGRREDRQEDLFAGMNDGCMRWGLCESPTESARPVRDLDGAGGVGGAE